MIALLITIVSPDSASLSLRERTESPRNGASTTSTSIGHRSYFHYLPNADRFIMTIETPIAPDYMQYRLYSGGEPAEGLGWPANVMRR